MTAAEDVSRRGGETSRPRSPVTLFILAALGLAAIAGLIWLGVWQIERRAWKHALVAAVDSRVHAPPVAAPGPAAWPTIDMAKDAYRHVTVSGRFDHRRETLVLAATGLGSGHWVLTPLTTATGETILINRGFVSSERRDPATRPAPAGAVTVTGLLRLTEPGGGFLRSNDPAADRWYSRDVPAIAAARGLKRVAPYFIDADAAPATSEGARTWPVGGLTVVRFPDNHLGYALTWFGLAALVAVAMLLVARHEWRQRR